MDEQPWPSPRVPVVWLCGPPGVGKTTIAWEVYCNLTKSGVRAGYVDIDQLGMCYPAPASDPERHRLKARNLNSVLSGYRASDVRTVVVSGVVDEKHGVAADEIPNGDVTVCRLRADHDELRQRLAARDAPLDMVEQVLREADELDASAVADLVIDTSRSSADHVVGRVLRHVESWPVAGDPSVARSCSGPPGHAAVGTAPPVLWLCGPTGVSKSTVGFAIFQRALAARLTAAYLDVDQIGFAGRRSSDHPARAGTVAAIWQRYQSVGAELLIMSGPVTTAVTYAAYASVLSGITLVRLQAGRDELTRRIVSRGRGGSWAQPGDPLRGQPIAELHNVADRAVALGRRLARDGIGRPVDSDGRTVDQTADAVLDAAALPVKI